MFNYLQRFTFNGLIAKDDMEHLIKIKNDCSPVCLIKNLAVQSMNYDKY